eukprot:771250-Pelagomonas_calceolata.AAC.1
MSLEQLGLGVNTTTMMLHGLTLALSKSGCMFCSRTLTPAQAFGFQSDLSVGQNVLHGAPTNLCPSSLSFSVLAVPSKLLMPISPPSEATGFSPM